jgi:hypothetical protein
LWSRLRMRGLHSLSTSRPGWEEIAGQVSMCGWFRAPRWFWCTTAAPPSTCQRTRSRTGTKGRRQLKKILAFKDICSLGLVYSGTGGLLERNSFSINITFTKIKIKT